MLGIVGVGLKGKFAFRVRDWSGFRVRNRGGFTVRDGSEFRDKDGFLWFRKRVGLV